MGLHQVFTKYKPFEFVLKLDDVDRHNAMLEALQEAEERFVRVHVYLLTDGKDVDIDQEQTPSQSPTQSSK